MHNIPFNKPYLSGKETDYIKDAVLSGKISGDGIFTKKCHDFFESAFNFRKVLLTTSCTDALEMAAILLDIREGDEVIAPSYTFVSTVNAFVLRGAKIIFVDSTTENPNMDAAAIEALITDRTKVIIPVHYGGMACDMDMIMDIAGRHGLFVVEDAAQAICSYHKGKRLGSIGHLAAFSFHETKNIISGEGGMLVINDDRFVERAEIIREKGTNRSAFFRGEVNKYGWVDIGSSFLPSDIIAAFLYAQLENIDRIQDKRNALWDSYFRELTVLEQEGLISLPKIPSYGSNNGHMFYIVTRNIGDRTALIAHLKEKGIYSVFHYLSLHKSEYYAAKHDGRELPEADRYTDTLLRLPLFFELEHEQIKYISGEVKRFFADLNRK